MELSKVLNDIQPTDDNCPPPYKYRLLPKEFIALSKQLEKEGTKATFANIDRHLYAMSMQLAEEIPELELKIIRREMKPSTEPGDKGDL